VWVEKRQVFDVPVVEPFVTEHRVPYYRCGCGQQTSVSSATLNCP
jgi:zinc-finger binding domain of transposase IS66